MLAIIIISSIISIIILFSIYLLHNKIYPNNTVDKRASIESGFESLDLNNNNQFYLSFYIIGILFIIFDLETVLLFPFSTLLALESSSSFNPYTSILLYLVFYIFLLFIIFGLIYEYSFNIF